MRLFFDIGNTRLKWVVEDRGAFIHDGMIAYDKADFSEIERLLLVSSGAEVNDRINISSVWASSVASASVASMLDSWVSQVLGCNVNWASVTREQGGVVNGYRNLEKLGVDRWMAILGASDYRKRHCLLDSPVIVVDAGTAVTIELLGVDDVYKGGVILPGLALMHDSLVGRAQKVSSTLTSVSGVLGLDTQECVNSGVKYGLVGAVERVVGEMMLLSGVDKAKTVLLITGGDANFIDNCSGLEFELVPHLVLSGLVNLANGGVR